MATKRMKSLSILPKDSSKMNKKEIDKYFKKRGINIDKSIERLGRKLLKQKEEMAAFQTAGIKGAGKFEIIKDGTAMLLMSTHLRDRGDFDLSCDIPNEKTDNSYRIACCGNQEKEAIELK